MASPTGRRLRISSTRNPGSTHGTDIDVRDADTGEAINYVFKIVLTLVAGYQNEAEVSYHEIGDNGSATIEKTTKVKDVEIDDLTAFEIMDEIRKDMR